jgi:FKBP-type peptidyl-prolyl cis-trans isomerase (trigger factor)
VSKPFQYSLTEKKIGDTLITEHLPLQNEFSSINNCHQYKFLITIKKITKGKNLCLESFKHNFKLKSKLEVHKKLIEVFSYRNDVSQRKAIIEELFHLLLSKHRFEVPKHFIMRRQEDILHALKQHPDYQVYKIQPDFSRQIELLAEKQLQEEILIDQISYKENIKIDEKDTHHYLHLFNNNRLKEFIYFKPVLEKIEDSQQPLQIGILKQSVLREKTLNHIIHVLTK